MESRNPTLLWRGKPLPMITIPTPSSSFDYESNEWKTRQPPWKVYYPSDWPTTDSPQLEWKTSGYDVHAYPPILLNPPAFANESYTPSGIVVNPTVKKSREKYTLNNNTTNSSSYSMSSIWFLVFVIVFILVLTLIIWTYSHKKK
jgi:hypothetical protein